LVALALIVAGAIGATGCSSSDEVIDSPSLTVDVDPIAYDYFGSVEVARGSSLDTSIQGVASSADVTVVESPAGVTATVVDADDGTTRLQLDIADDAQVGTQAIIFDIEGEPESVTWTIEVLAP
jgi:hypothetical protein